MTNYVDIDFESFDVLEKEIEKTINIEVNNFLSQDHLKNARLTDKDMLISNYVRIMLGDIIIFVSDVYYQQMDALMQEINEELISSEAWEEDEAWDSGLDSDLDKETEKEIEELTNELEQMEKQEKQEKQEPKKKVKINWGPEWEGF